MDGRHKVGYCGQQGLPEQGVSALLTANLSKCFGEYCRCENMDTTIEDRTSILHQSCLTSASAGGASADIALYFRFVQAEADAVFAGLGALIPVAFITFMFPGTIFTGASVDDAFVRASVTANHLLRCTRFDEFPAWVPLLGVVMSTEAIILRLYSLSIVDKSWRIAEIDVVQWSIYSAEDFSKRFRQLLHVLTGWTKHCADFLCSPFAAVTAPAVISDQLVLHKDSDIIVVGEKVFKCFDYRDISDRSHVGDVYRRGPSVFWMSDLDVELVVDWRSEFYPQRDNLQIVRYSFVP
eukprot:gene50655-61959_t